MQRRAAAIYFVFFLVIAAGAWAFIGYAEDTREPQFGVSGVEFESGSTHTIDGTAYSVAEIEVSGGGGHGGGGQLETTLTWENGSGILETTVQNNSTMTYRDTTYRVLIANQTNVSEATLRQEFNVTAILADDPAVEDHVAVQNGTRYVVYSENDSLRPLDEYLPDPDTETLEAGETITYDGNESTVAVVEPNGLTLQWRGTVVHEADLTEGGNVTLDNDVRYFAHFTEGGSMQLVPGEQYPEYAATVDEREYFHERISGLWALTIISAIAALFLLATAYLPHRG